MSQTPWDPETYRETEHEGTAAVVELVALVLAARGSRAGTAPGADGHHARVEPALEEILDAARALLAAGSMAVVLRTMADPAGDGSLGLGAVLREVYVRNLAYPHMVEETLIRLFDDPGIVASCKAAVGVSVVEILAVFEAANALWRTRFGARMAHIGELGRLARVEMAKARQAGYAIEPEVRAHGRSLLDAAFADPADVSILQLDDIAAEADLAPGVVARVVDLLATDMRASAPETAAQADFEGRSPLRVRPILRDATDGSVIVHGGLPIPAIRERVEEALKQASM